MEDFHTMFKLSLISKSLDDTNTIELDSFTWIDDVEKTKRKLDESDIETIFKTISKSSIDASTTFEELGFDIDDIRTIGYELENKFNIDLDFDYCDVDISTIYDLIKIYNNYLLNQ